MIAGIVIATLVVGLLAYVLWALQAGGEVQRLDIEEQDGTTLTTVVVRSAKSDNDTKDVPVSTPQLRAAARHNIAVASRRAMRRRRLGLTLSVLVSAIVVAVTGAVPTVSAWWLMAAPGILLAWVCLTRVSVVVVGRHLAELRAEVERGDDEPTKLIVVPTVMASASIVKPVEAVDHEESVDMDKPAEPPAKPSQPLLVSPATYVNQPMLPRSVRRVDLSALGKQSRFPVNANSPQDELPLFFEDAPRTDSGESDSLPQAV